jgi:ABC-2 type transport system permease protein
MTAPRTTPAWAVLASAELILLRRSALVALIAIAVPIGFGTAWVFLARDSGAQTDYGSAAAIQLLLLLACTPYMAGTTALAARRQHAVLKRWRTSGASSADLIIGLLSPYALLVVVQAVLLFTVTAVVGGAAPARWWPLAVGMLGGTVMAGALAFATAAFTRTPELAQFTTTPVFLALFGSGMWVTATPPGEVSWPMLAIPGAAVTQLVRAGWNGAAPGQLLDETWPSIVALLVLTVLSVALAVRVFRWESR